MYKNTYIHPLSSLPISPAHPQPSPSFSRWGSRTAVSMALLKLLDPCLVLRSYSAQHLGLFHHTAKPEGPLWSPTLHSTPSTAPDHLHNKHRVSGAPQPSIILPSALTSPDLPPHLCTNCAFCWAAMPTLPFKVCFTCQVLGSQGFSTLPIGRKIFSEIPCGPSFVHL